MTEFQPMTRKDARPLLMAFLCFMSIVTWCAYTSSPDGPSAQFPYEIIR